MTHATTDFAPTSTATTRETEPEVVAGISSADLNPSQPLSFRTSGGGLGYGRMLMLLAAGLAIGFGAARFVRSR